MKVERIDHVHIEVSDRDRAADWYGRVLGLKRDPKLASWADDPMGPLILSTEDGMPVLSLFNGECRSPSRDGTIAFRMSGMSFLAFLTDLPKLNLTHEKGHTLSRSDMVDHDLSWSIYFVDPYGNRIEATTYDYREVAAAI